MGNGIQSGKLNFSTFDPQLKGDADSIAQGRRVSLFSRSPGKIIFTDEKLFPVVVSYRWKNFP